MDHSPASRKDSTLVPYTLSQAAEGHCIAQYQQQQEQQPPRRGGRGGRGRGGRLGPPSGGGWGSYPPRAASSAGGHGGVAAQQQAVTAGGAESPQLGTPKATPIPVQQAQREAERPQQASPEGAAGGGGGGSGSYGRSPPGRNFIAANFLLSFQSSRPGGQAYDRNKFLQANFRFLVSDAVDTRRFESDADLMLDWEDVVQVEMLSPVPIDCPISLHAPLCPQITPCGHVFSFPAIMQHLVNHGGPELRKSAPCPLCFTQVSARELRLVRVMQVQAAEVGSEVTWCLLRRPRGSIIPQPTAGSVPSPTAGTASAAVPKAPGSPSHTTTKPGSSSGVDSGDKPSSPTGKKAQGPTQAPWGRTAANAAKAGAAGAGRDGAGAGAASASKPARAGELQCCSAFAKFTTLADPLPLWLAAAEELAQYASQVTAEGGLDAALEAPNVYAAMDALAARARAWAERRVRLLAEQAGEGGAAALVAPEEAGRAAAMAVKQATTAAVSAETVARDRRAEQQERERLFPSLSATSAPAGAASPGARRPAAGPPPAGAPAAPAQQAQRGAESAWGPESDGEDAPGDAQEPPEGVQGSGMAGFARSAPAAVPVPVPAASATPAAPGETAGPAELSSSDKSGGASALLGTSPAGQEGVGAPPGDYYFYQASDGQWLFLHPLNSRMLLHHFGAYATCPPAITAKVVEVEGMTMDESTRRRLKVLGHLPLTGAFKLCEVDLAPLLPPEALAPFADELAQRERKRTQRVKQEARQAAKEAAAAAAAAAAANRGFSHEDLRAMPLPSASRLPEGWDPAGDPSEYLGATTASADAPGREEDPLGPAGAVLGASPPPAAPPQQGVSFARITRMGFAATGPSLAHDSPTAAVAAAAAGGGGELAGGGLGVGTDAPASVGLAGAAAAAEPAGPVLQGAWGAPKPGGLAAAAAVTGGSKGVGGLGRAFAELGPAGAQQAQQEGAGGAKGKGKKGGKQVLLLSGAQRRY
ncbi:hypothetical protein N2152v2_007376 [Parachlorella kessleri]